VDYPKHDDKTNEHRISIINNDIDNMLNNNIYENNIPKKINGK
jgi:hypothetical protein